MVIYFVLKDNLNTAARASRLAEQQEKWQSAWSGQPSPSRPSILRNAQRQRLNPIGVGRCRTSSIGELNLEAGSTGRTR